MRSERERATREGVGRHRAQETRDWGHWTNLTEREDDAWAAAVEKAFPGSLKPQDAHIVRLALSEWVERQGVAWPAKVGEKSPAVLPAPGRKRRA